MTKPDDKKDPDLTGGDATAEKTALDELAAKRTPRTGVQAAVEALRQHYDEEAHILWTTTGPRRTHTEEIAGVLVEIGGARRIVVVLGFASGAFKLFLEAGGKTADDQFGAIHRLLGLTPAD